MEKSAEFTTYSIRQLDIMYASLPETDPQKKEIRDELDRRLEILMPIKRK